MTHHSGRPAHISTLPYKYIQTDSYKETGTREITACCVQSCTPITTCDSCVCMDKTNTEHRGFALSSHNGGCIHLMTRIEMKNNLGLRL